MVRFAREIVQAEVRHAAPPPMRDFGRASPVFVTIERNGQILGCRGSLAPRRATLAEELVDTARGAAAHDPRYRPVREQDLNGFLVTVTVVDRLEPISDAHGIRPEDGLVLSSGSKKGVVLPWEGKDPALRLKWAYQKAGVPVGSAVTLQRMVAERWRG
ncbi:AMMECR1 domain-containing protein [Fimbriimonas ginsengisoli]|uniref:AMMECR1 domain-containing protein n=1 Tax=Fimbriimonas ginsengisoli TaxID=1005039 RepID=UPI001D0DF183|nr:AMMECR1 domain-containing protein [Fimbriimonas ginsengisoli]